MTRQRLILASASPRRSQLMEQVGLKPEVIPSTAEEETNIHIPEQMVIELSRRKAEEVFSRFKKEIVVIGADTVVVAEGRILGKPKDYTDAVQMLTLIQGKVHQVYTGVTILAGNEEKKRITFAEQTDVCVYPMNETEILRYVKSGEPMDKAGAYGIQGQFAAYIQEIHGDYNNVVGLPVGRLYQELKTLGVLEERQ